MSFNLSGKFNELVLHIWGLKIFLSRICVYIYRSSGEGMAIHSCILAWKIPWREEPGGLQSMGSQRIGHNWATSLSFYIHIYTHTHTHTHIYAYLHLYLYITSSDQNKPNFKQEIINSGQIGLNVLIWPVGWQWQMLVVQSCLDSLQPHGLFMEFSRQEYWSGLSFPSPGYLPNAGIEPGPPALQAFFTIWTSREAPERSPQLDCK